MRLKNSRTVLNIPLQIPVLVYQSLNSITYLTSFIGLQMQKKPAQTVLA